MQGTPFDTRLGEPFTVQVDSCWRIQRMRWPFWLYYGILVAQSESDVAIHEEANDTKRPPTPTHRLQRLRLRLHWHPRPTLTRLTHFRRIALGQEPASFDAAVAAATQEPLVQALVFGASNRSGERLFVTSPSERAPRQESMWLLASRPGRLL